MQKSLVENWLDNYKLFFKEAQTAILQEKNCEDTIKKKMILGILDNQRNFLLILLNKMIIDRSDNANYMINLDKINSGQVISEIYKNLLEIDKMMSRMCFDSTFKISNLSVNEFLNTTITISDWFLEYFRKQGEKEDYSKEFRVYREIDNFIENFITCYLTLNNIENFDQKGYCGLSYGGIELSIIMKLISKEIKNISILSFNKNITGYTKKQSVDLSSLI